MNTKLAALMKFLGESVEDDTELVENFPEWAVAPIYYNDWGNYIQTHGEEQAREDFADIDNFMTTNGYSGIQSDDENTHSGYTSHPAFGKACETCSVYARKGPWKSLIHRYGLDTTSPVTESIDDQPNELTEESVKKLINSLGLDIINKWYDGNQSRPVFDCKTTDGKTICVWNEPPYEAKLWFKEANPRDNGFTEDIVTLDDLKAKLSNLIGNIETDKDDFEQQLGSSLDTAMMDHYDMMNGDIGDIDMESAGTVQFTREDDTDHLFEASLNKLCTVAGKPALAEAVMKLYKVYHPVMEAVGVPTESSDAPYDDDNDDELPASSDRAICMICGNPCSIGCFRGGSVVCPSCQDKRWSRYRYSLGRSRKLSPMTESSDNDDVADADNDLPASSDRAICMICGNPCSIGCFRGGSVVCPSCQAKRWSRYR